MHHGVNRGEGALPGGGGGGGGGGSELGAWTEAKEARLQQLARAPACSPL